MNPKNDTNPLGRVVTDSASQAWTTGLNLLDQAEKEGGRLFTSVLRVGDVIQSQTMKTADSALRTVYGSRKTFTLTLGKIEELIELRITRALNALQIPTARDIQQLTGRVDELSRKVAAAEITPGVAKAKKQAATKTGTTKKRNKTTKKTAKKAVVKKKASTRKKTTTKKRKVTGKKAATKKRATKTRAAGKSRSTAKSRR